MVIITADSRYVNLEKFSQDDVRLHEIAIPLSKICRYNGATDGLYSVAEHSLVLASTFEGDSELILYALLHDAAEAYLGDICEPFKSHLSVLGRSGHVGVHRFEERIQGAIFEAFGLLPRLPDIVRKRDIALVEVEMRRLFDGPFPDWLQDKWSFSNDVRESMIVKRSILGLDHLAVYGQYVCEVDSVGSF